MARETVAGLNARIASLEMEQRTLGEQLQGMSRREAQLRASLKLIATVVAQTLESDNGRPRPPA